jgi:hypothetical protein
MEIGGGTWEEREGGEDGERGIMRGRDGGDREGGGKGEKMGERERRERVR